MWSGSTARSLPRAARFRWSDGVPTDFPPSSRNQSPRPNLLWRSARPHAFRRQACQWRCPIKTGCGPANCFPEDRSLCRATLSPIPVLFSTCAAPRQSLISARSASGCPRTTRETPSGWFSACRSGWTAMVVASPWRDRKCFILMRPFLVRRAVLRPWVDHWLFLPAAFMHPGPTGPARTSTWW